MKIRVPNLLLSFSAITSLSLCLPALADWAIFPCGMDRGCWEVGGAAIYEQTCVLSMPVADGQTIVTTSGLTATDDSLFDISPKAYWGFEVWLGWHNCNGCDFANVTYKRLHSYRDSKVFNNFGSFNVVSVNHVGDFAGADIVEIAARQRTRYDRVRALYGRTAACICDARFYSFLAGRYVGAEISRSLAVASRTVAPAAWQERTRFDGGGVEFGLGADYTVGCGFSLVGSAGVIALFGNRQDSFRAAILSAGAAREFNKRRFTKCVSGIDLSTGVRYAYDLQMCGCCLRLLGEVGWQMDYFWNILGLRISDFGAATSTFFLQDTVATNFGTSGLYLALSVRF